MKRADLKVGDVVRLKSGGRDMTIHCFDRPPAVDLDRPLTVTCVWHNNCGDPQGKQYASEQLLYIDREAAPGLESEEIVS